MNNSFILIVMCTIGFLACKGKGESVRQNAMTQGSDYWQFDTTGPLQMEARFLPPELLAFKETKKENADYQKLKKEFSEQILFKVNLKWRNGVKFLEDNIKKEEEYYKRLNYFIANAKKDFYLYNSKDTSQSKFVEVERTFGQTPFLSLLVGFNKIDNNENINLIYSGRIWNLPDVQILFKKEIFQN